MKYEFVGYECNHIKQPKGTTDKLLVCHHEIDFPMKNAPDLGTCVACPHEGCKGKVTRVMSTQVQVCVRGSEYDWKPGESMVMKTPDGPDLRCSFVDHPHTDPAYQRRLDLLAGQNGVGNSKTPGLGQAYYSPKHGRVCVDVMSSEKDPLGKFEKAKREGKTTTEKVSVRQPYKVRKSK